MSGKMNKYLGTLLVYYDVISRVVQECDSLQVTVL